MCHAVHQTPFLADVPYNKLLVWFKVSDSGMPSILDPHKNSGMSCSCPESWRSCSSVSADWSLHRLQQVIDGADVGVGQLKALNMGLDSTWVAQFRPPLGQTLPLKGQDQLFCMHCKKWVRTSYPACIARNGDSSLVAGTAVCWQPLKVRATSPIHRPVGPVWGGGAFPLRLWGAGPFLRYPDPKRHIENILKNKP